MTPEAEELRDFMSDLSEEAWHAGWMKNLEYDLWKAVVEGPRKYGRLSLTSEHIGKLRTLASACGGWILFHEQQGEEWIPLVEWEGLYRSKAANG